jgi:hypothetical protein
MFGKKKKQLCIFKDRSKFYVSVNFMQQRNVELLKDKVYQINTVKMLRETNHGHPGIILALCTLYHHFHISFTIVIKAM